MPQIGWIDALRQYNLGGSSWCIPRKGTAEYDRVMVIRKGEEEPKPRRRTVKAVLPKEEPEPEVKAEPAQKSRTEELREEVDSMRQTITKMEEELAALEAELAEEKTHLFKTGNVRRINKLDQQITKSKKALKQANADLERKIVETQQSYIKPKYEGPVPKTKIADMSALYRLSMPKGHRGSNEMEMPIYELEDGEMKTRYFIHYHSGQAKANKTDKVFKDIEKKDSKIIRKVAYDPAAEAYYIAKKGGGEERFVPHKPMQDELIWLKTGDQPKP